MVHTSADRGRIGIRIWNRKKLYEHLLHEWLPCESRIRSVILHVGTNNASTLRDNTPIRQCAEEIFDVMELLNSIYPQAEIWFSGILPRLDDDHKRGLNINEVKLSGIRRPSINPRFSKQISSLLGHDMGDCSVNP